MHVFFLCGLFLNMAGWEDDGLRILIIQCVERSTIPNLQNKDISALF